MRFRVLGLLAAAGLVAAGVLPVGTAHGQYFRFGKNKVQYEAPTWYYLQTRHFDVYYYDGGQELADFTAKAAEAAYAQIEDLFQYEIAQRIPILVYQSHNDFVVTNAVDLPTYSEGIGGVTELFKNRIALPFTGDYRDYRRVVHHELVHAVLNDMFYGGSIQSIIQNNIQLRIPGWFNEGLAEYAALGWDTKSDMYVREAVLEDDLAPIERLGGYFAYRGGQSVWDYIAEQYGREKVAEILQRLRLSRNVEGAFRRATGLGLDELSERWQQNLKEIYYPELAAREDLDEIGKALITREDGFYNTSPALSPRGDRLAFITTRNGLFDVYLASANDGQILRKLVDGQTSPEFESLRILTPGLTWSPDGTRIALAVKSGRSDAIAVVDVETGAMTHYRVPDVDQIVTVAWHPSEERIAFEASMDAQSDIYVLDLATHETVNHTHDVFSDHEPAWSPDGAALVFHSDRGAYTAVGRYDADGFAMIDHDYGQFDVYRLPLGAQEAERLTFDAVWDDHSAHFGADPNRLLFLSDRNGVPNLYERDLVTGAVRPLTDLTVGISQVSLSADGEKAALVSLREGTPSIYLLKAPFERRLPDEPLAPTVWAQRVMQHAARPAPALALAPESRRQANPFLRDATDGLRYARVPEPSGDLLASRVDLLLGEPAPDPDAGRSEAPSPDAPTDSTTYGSVRVDFRNYVFSEAFDEARREEERPSPRRVDVFDPVDNLDEDGDYRPQRYKLTFSPDIVYGTAGFDALYGVQGVTQMMFSDILGNHRIVVATNLLIDLRNSDYLFAYQYLPRRVDWSFSGFHLARLLPDYQREVYYRFRRYGAGVTAVVPLDKFRRLETDLSLVGVSQMDITDARVDPETRMLLYPSVTYTKDVTTPGYLYPIGGHRFALSLSGSPGSLGAGTVRFARLLGDVRTYRSAAGGYYTFAVRLSGGTSFGPEPQQFYTSGVQNWINRRFDDDNGFPVSDATDFLFASPVLPLRGFEINARNGSSFGLLNAEVRFPLVAALLPGPLPILPLYNLQGTAFVDAGSVWGGAGGGFNVFRDDADGERVLDDLLVGSGFGLRTILLGYPVKLDFAWPFDGRRFGDRTVYFAVGFDF